MTTPKTTTLGPLLQSFFTQHLQHNKRVSPQTVASYRDTLKLLLQFIQVQQGREPATLCVTDLDVTVISHGVAGNPLETTLGQLLPHSFGPEFLGR